MKITKDAMHAGLTIAGNPVDIHRYRLQAEKTGPKVYLQGGIHGGEITYWILHRLFNHLKDNLQAGAVTIVPFANPLAWEQRSYFYTHGKFDLTDGRDFNRNFPGREQGSMHQRIAHLLFTEARGHDLVVDLHTSRESIPFCIFNKMDYAPHVKAIGLPYNYYCPDDDPAYAGSLDCAMDDAGVDNVIIECGSHDEYDAEKIENVYNGLLRALARLGMIDAGGIAAPAAACRYFTETRKILAPQSGFIRYDAALAAPFKKGDGLFTLYETATLGAERQIDAPEDGVMFKHAPTHIYKTGDETLHYIPADDLKPL